jgi:hypothetical protein
MRTLPLVAVAALVGGFVFNRWIKGTLVEEKPGFGMDDLAFAATVAGSFYLLHRFVPKGG